MTGKQLAWHLVRLALAAALLVFDIRVFLFYAFTILLGIGWDLDHLRASVRVLNVRTEAKLMALLADRKITESDVTRTADEMLGQWSDSDRESLELDVRRCRRQPLF